MPPQNIPLWLKDYFELIIFSATAQRRSSEKRVEVALLQGKVALERGLYQEESYYQKSLTHLRDLSAWQGNLCSPNICSSHLSCLMPQILFPSLAQDSMCTSLNCLAAFWVLYLLSLMGLPCVILKVFLLLICLLLTGGGGGGGGLSQEPRRVEGKLFFLPNGGHLPAKERGSEKKPTLPTTWLWTYSLQNCEEINFCCMSLPLCGALSWQP